MYPTYDDPNVKKYADYVGRDAQVYLDGLNEYSNFKSLNLQNIGMGDLLRHGNDYKYLQKQSDPNNPMTRARATDSQIEPNLNNRQNNNYNTETGQDQNNQFNPFITPFENNQNYSKPQTNQRPQSSQQQNNVRYANNMDTRRMADRQKLQSQKINDPYNPNNYIPPPKQVNQVPVQPPKTEFDQIREHEQMEKDRREKDREKRKMQAQHKRDNQRKYEAQAKDFEYPQPRGFNDPFSGKDDEFDDKVIQKFGADGIQKHLAGDDVKLPDNFFHPEEKVIMNLPESHKQQNQSQNPFNRDISNQFPTRMPMALPDNDTLAKKNKELTQKLLQAQKESAKQQVQIEELVNKVKDLDQFKNKLKESLLEMNQKKMDNENNETERSYDSSRPLNKTKMADLDFLREMRNKQMQSDRDTFRKSLFNGVDLIDDVNGLKAYRKKMKKNVCQKFIEYISQNFDKLVPLASDVKKIGLRYDKSVESYYTFFRYLVGLAILTFLIFLTMQIVYLYYLWDTRTSFCVRIIPCMLLFSRYPNGKELYYIFTLIAFILFVFVCNMYKWMNFDKKMRWDDLNGDKEKVISKIFFNAWDWSTDTQSELLELKTAKLREVKLTVEEEKIKGRIKNRTKKEKAKLIALRTTTFIISFFILCSGWAAIVAVYLYEADIESYFTHINIIKYIASFIPQLVITFVNVMIPAALLKVSTYEKWDFVKDLINQSYTLIAFSPTTYDCREDQAGLNMVKLSSNSHQTGSNIMILLNISFMLIMIYYGCLLYIPVSHEQYYFNPNKQCGMFESETYMFNDLDTLLTTNGSILLWIRYIIFFYPILYLLIMILASALKFKTNHIQILKLSLIERQQASQLIIDELQGKLGQYKKKLELNKMM
eukprot:403353765